MFIMFKQTLALVGLTLSLSANAAVVEVGDLNIINDAGNASDGLRYLDMTYSDGLTQAAALTNAQVSYANARLATASEWDDLFAAAGIAYSGAFTASDAFTSGNSALLAKASSQGVWLAGALGLTSGSDLFVWSDPDNQSSSASTRDFLFINYDGSATIEQISAMPALPEVGFLLVSEAPVPVPAAGWLFMSALIGLVGKKRLARR
jgi:hypothetical protein